MDWREETARVKRRMYRDEDYWGRPLAAFGDPQARLLDSRFGAGGPRRQPHRTHVYRRPQRGLAVWSALYRAGFANQPESTRPGDGLQLQDALITAAARCAPPQNKLRPDELTACRPYITREIELLTDLRVVVALGRIAFDAFLRAYAAAGRTPPARKPPFGHNVATQLPNNGPLLIACYHPSQQNTQTGRLTLDMLDAVFQRAREACGLSDSEQC